METGKITIYLKSACIPGSAEGLGGIIDTDVMHTPEGIPYIPARRIKGLLRESASEVKEMCDLSDIEHSFDVDKLLGEPGGSEAVFIIDDFYPEGLKEALPALKALSEKYPQIINRESVLGVFTGVRGQTKLENGVAKKHSLRVVRYIKEGRKFSGTIKYNPEQEDLLILAVKNLRNMGSKRNRGFGQIECSIFTGADQQEVNNKKVKEILR